MSVSPSEWLEHAKRLGGSPAEVDLRRAISAAYYALFHALVGAIVDTLLPGAKPDDKNFASIYRTPKHDALKKGCEGYRAFCRDYSLSASAQIMAFADAFIKLQASRHTADYAPVFPGLQTEVGVSIKMAEDALRSFESAGLDETRPFLSLLLVPIRPDRESNKPSAKGSLGRSSPLPPP